MSFSLIYADTITVDIDGTGDYITIQEGIDNSVDGDIVLVYPGRYIDNVNFNGHSITLASLELTTGNEAYIDSTIIDGNRAGSCVTVLNNEDAVISGFTITNGKGTEWPNEDARGGGILAANWYADNTKLDVINCVIEKNIARNGGGMFIGGAASKILPITLSGVTIKQNYSIIGGGIHDYFAKPIFDSDNLCNIYNNHAGMGQDIYAYDSCHVHIVVDTFTVMNPEGYFAEYIRFYDYAGEVSFDIQNAWLEEINHDLYVAANGDDNNSGLSQDDPLKTIALATYRIASDSLNQKTVHVAEGDYSQALNDQIFPISLKSNTSLVGENIDTKIIHDDSFNNITIYFSNNKKNITVEELTLEAEVNVQSIINSSKEKNVKNTFRNLIFRDIMCVGGSAIRASYSDSIYYENILFNNIQSDNVGCIFHNKYNAIMRNCVFINNVSSGALSYITKFNANEFVKTANCIFSNKII